MKVSTRDIEVFKAAFYNNTSDEADDPVEIALKAVFATKRMNFVQIKQGVKINPEDVSVLEWDRRFYMNGSSSTLVIRMNTGATYHVNNDAWTDAYEIERSIQAAMVGAA